jgi:6,7-dimethyl-8-ribityllumazine synthase
MTPTVEGILDAKGIKIALVVSRFNDFITTALLRGAEDFLERHGCPSKNCTIVRVPGSWEIPQTAKRLALGGKYDAVVGLGALIRGETPHFELLAAEVAKGLAQVGMETGIPVIFGVLTTDTVEQAIDRAGAKSGNKGWDAARSAVEMVNLFRRLA